MSVQETFKSYFSGWPDEILAKFPDTLLEAELAGITGGNYGGWQDWHSAQLLAYNGVFDYALQDANRQAGYNFNKAFTFYSPSNSQFAQTYSAPNNTFYAWLWGGRRIGSESWWNDDANWIAAAAHWNNKQRVSVDTSLTYDNRLYTITGYGSHQWYIDQGDIVWVRMYPPWANIIGSLHFPAINTVLMYRSHFHTQYKPFQGIESVIAWIENGVVNPGVNVSQAYDFRDYVNAFRKYNAQIAQTANLAATKSQNALADFQRDLNVNLQTEKNRLQSLAYQVQNATENDTRSAIRDMQNLQINAQNLFLNLRRSI